MMTVDWLLFGEHACICLGLAGFAGIVMCVALIIIGTVRDWYRDRQADDFALWETETASNVVFLHPRTRLYNWEAEGDAS